MRKKKNKEGKWNLYETRLRGLMIIDGANDGFTSRSDIEIGRILKCPTAYVRNMIDAGVTSGEFTIHICDSGERRLAFNFEK